MWYFGRAKFQRARSYEFDKMGVKASWNAVVSPYGPDLTVNPLAFMYAAARTSITGEKLGLHGLLAGIGQAQSALAFLQLCRGSSELAMHKNFPLAKDFIRTGITGTVGAALSYLEMMDLGYKWAGHWEDCVSGFPSGKHPDFVFASSNSVCLLDAKGKGSLDQPVDSRVKTGWRAQIYPHRAQPMVFGGTANEGRVIGAQLEQLTGSASAARAELVVAHGQWAAARASPTAIASAQRGNFVSACFLLGLPAMAAALMKTSVLGRVSQRGFENPGDVLGRADVSGASVFVGPTRAVVNFGQSQWAMRPYCRPEALELVVAKFLGGEAGAELPTFEPQGVVDADSSRGVHVVEGGDGFGAEFVRI